MSFIAFVVNELPGGWEPMDVRLGGTEESVVRWAQELAKLGHNVEIYRNSHTYEAGGVLQFGGVYYRERRDFVGWHFDVVVNVKSPDIPPLGPTWYFTNETDVSKRDLSDYEGVIWPSHWAANNIKVRNERVEVVPHGYDPEEIYPDTKIPKQVLYASSPDRGLATLLLVWPRVAQRHPDAQLIVTYGAPAQDTPNVTFLGDVDEATMNELYRMSDIWCHPCSGGELFGITALKAQAAGCVPVYFPTMALTETVRAGWKSNPVALADDLIRMLGNEDLKTKIRAELAQQKWPTWASTARQLLEVILPKP